MSKTGAASTVEPPQALTIPQIARRLGLEPKRVAYLVKSKGISPMAKAGTTAIFDESIVAAVDAEATRLDNARAAKLAARRPLSPQPSA